MGKHHSAQFKAQVVRAALRNAYRTGDVAQARRVWHGDDAVDRLHARLVATILETMGHTASPDALTTNTYVLWVSHNLERIADRASAICERVLFIATGDRWRRRAS